MRYNVKLTMAQQHKLNGNEHNFHYKKNWWKWPTKIPFLYKKVSSSVFLFFVCSFIAFGASIKWKKFKIIPFSCRLCGFLGELDFCGDLSKLNLKFPRDNWTFSYGKLRGLNFLVWKDNQTPSFNQWSHPVAPRN